MPPSRFGGAGDTYVHPLVVAAVLLAAVAMFALPRKRVIAPFLASCLLIPMDQVLVLGGLHFQMLRVLILIAWVRALVLKNSQPIRFLAGGWNAIDTCVALWAGFTAIDFVLLWQDFGAVTNQLGTLYTVFGIYFLLRFLIRSQDDVVHAVKVLACAAVVVAVVMTIEKTTARNLYAYLWSSGFSGPTVMERDGHLRAMACFAHPLLAGTFGGICLPLFFVLWFRGGRNRRLAIVGMVAATVIVLAASSSTPLLAYLAGLIALAFWPFRKQMRVFRWATALVLLTLHLVMKAPVWALIGRIDVTGSSSSYHRYQLIDQFIRRFGDWWLVGTRSNGDWGWDMWDQANQYVAVGETGGLLPFLCFVAILVIGFRYVGRARRVARGDRKRELFVWTLGAALFANVVAFFGISYFDQTMVVWYLMLASLGAMAASMAAVQKTVAIPVAKEEWISADLTEAEMAVPQMRVSDLS